MAVSPVSLPLQGPVARSRTTPVASEIRATSRAIGNPSPLGCELDYGNSFWFSSISGIEIVVPSTIVTRQPFQTQPSRARPSISDALARTSSRTARPSGSHCRVSRFEFVSGEQVLP